jgi:hypothetical protein
VRRTNSPPSESQRGAEREAETLIGEHPGERLMQLDELHSSEGGLGLDRMVAA